MLVDQVVFAPEDRAYDQPKGAPVEPSLAPEPAPAPGTQVTMRALEEAVLPILLAQPAAAAGGDCSRGILIGSTGGGAPGSGILGGGGGTAPAPGAQITPQVPAAALLDGNGQVVTVADSIQAQRNRIGWWIMLALLLAFIIGRVSKG